jgi:hypothetical protein
MPGCRLRPWWKNENLPALRRCAKLAGAVISRRRGHIEGA